MQNFHRDGICPIRDVLSRLGDKWSLLVLVSLQTNGVMRFGDLQRSIGDVSQRMLTVTLRTLEADGIVERKAYAGGASAGGIPSDRPGPEPDALPERVGGMGAAARGRHPGKQKVEATHPPWFDDTIEEVLCENSGRALGDGLSRTQIGWVGRIYLI